MFIEMNKAKLLAPAERHINYIEKLKVRKYASNLLTFQLLTDYLKS